MTPPLVVGRCPKNHIVRYRAGQSEIFCTICQTKWKANPRSHPAQYGNDLPPRPLWKRWNSRINDPAGPRRPPTPNRAPSHNPYHNPAYTPPPILTPAEVGVTQQPPPQLLKPDPLGTPVATSSVAPIKPAASASPIAGIFWAAFSLTMIGVVVALLLKPTLMVDVIRLVSSSLGGASSDACAQVRQEFSSIDDCSPSTAGIRKSGYSWCEVTLRNGGGPDWNLNGTNMAMSDLGQAWIPNECVP